MSESKISKKERTPRSTFVFLFRAILCVWIVAIIYETTLPKSSPNRYLEQFFASKILISFAFLWFVAVIRYVSYAMGAEVKRQVERSQGEEGKVVSDALISHFSQSYALWHILDLILYLIPTAVLLYEGIVKAEMKPIWQDPILLTFAFWVELSLLRRLWRTEAQITWFYSQENEDKSAVIMVVAFGFFCALCLILGKIQGPALQ